MSSREANALAEEAGLDLVKISPTAQPPVCKIMNYGKYLFELTKKAKEAKKNQKVVEIKEIWLSYRECIRCFRDIFLSIPLLLC